jgi:hypothetical protein
VINEELRAELRAAGLPEDADGLWEHFVGRRFGIHAYRYLEEATVTWIGGATPAVAPVSREGATLTEALARLALAVENRETGTDALAKG